MINREIAIFWFRRDLRLKDNHALLKALESGLDIMLIFIFDTNILDRLESKEDRRVDFIYTHICNIEKELSQTGTHLNIFYGDPFKIYSDLFKKHNIKEIYFNSDYEPYTITRDAAIGELASTYGVRVREFKDHIIFSPQEILKSDLTPYTVYTPYSKRWIEKISNSGKIDIFNSLDILNKEISRVISFEEYSIFPLEKTGFLHINNRDASESSISEIPVIDPNKISVYDKTRDYPSVDGTSRIGHHLRFGTISVREAVNRALDLNTVWLKELIWREFFISILYHFPKVEHSPFKPTFDNISWRNNYSEIELWFNGKTGYPLVDAGMRELNSTGYMHNRVRMATASFFTKHLLADWRIGEQYFASKLLDFELASNNGNWQWSAGCGCDAAPYFRVFNPTLQQSKFDPEFKYIKRWVPEFGTPDYPSPIVDHKYARERFLQQFKQ